MTDTTTELTDEERTKLLEQLKGDKNVVNQRNGVGAFALYMEAVEFKASDGKFVRHAKVFVAGDRCVTYMRDTGKKTARWNVLGRAKDGAIEQAKTFLAGLGARPGLVVDRRDEALVIELTASDLESLAKDDAPYARYVGSFAIESRCGKVEDDAVLPQARIAELLEGSEPATATDSSGNPVTPF